MVLSKRRIVEWWNVEVGGVAESSIRRKVNDDMVQLVELLNRTNGKIVGWWNGEVNAWSCRIFKSLNGGRVELVELSNRLIVEWQNIVEWWSQRSCRIVE